MTHSVMTSKMNSLGNSVNSHYSRYSKAEKLYQVEIEDFDGEVFYYEVEAKSDEEANEKATELHSGDIYMMNIYEY